MRTAPRPRLPWQRYTPATGCSYITICGGNYHPSGFGAGDARNFVPAALDEIADVASDDDE